MHAKRLLAIATLIAIPGTPLASCVAPHQAKGGGEPPTEFAPLDPSEFDHFNGQTLLLTADWWVSVRKYQEAKRIDFAFRNSAGGFEVLRVPLSYVPTAVTPVLRNGAIQYLVGGVDDTSGTTLLEVWALRPPMSSVDRATEDSELCGAGVESVHRFFSSTSAGQYAACNLWRSPVDDSRAIAQFIDGKEIHSVSIADGSSFVLAAGEASSGGFHVPELLAHSHIREWTRNHGTYGFITVMRCVLSEPAWLILCDSDRDGSIDATLKADDSTWDGLLLGDYQYYLD